ncbi:class I SAM-dependent DNA methyltransferase [Micromonospora sp. HM5-17]|uniref:class I SAM-dependent DNA methyltransferase n=1 Tax=Micromonospora sp. HM5-17 TaxID=2487710 RepID=UPI000F49CA25|nr:class I SAM-dependent DNA methyltransferase [Micromonospora sp. HM5-17]ROT32522.1 class I SAM-dependent DNA methyltransferase [Micromonospora sp. HM5-17]
MSVESLTNRGEYLSPHYLAEVLPNTVRDGLAKRWAAEERGGRLTPRAGLRGFRRDYFDRKTELTDRELFDPERLRKLHGELLKALGFHDPAPGMITVERAGQEQQIPVAHAEPGTGTGHGIVAIDCGWAVDTDAAQDPTEAGRLLTPVELAGGERIETGAKLASWLFAAEDPPRYVLILNGAVITLADRSVWGEGRYLAVSLDALYGRNDEREYDVVAALFGADSLRPPAEGGSEPLTELVAGSRQHAVGVNSELREGLRTSVELIANEVLDRIREAGYRPEEIADLDELARDLSREALRYLYRILFLLYAEARPELGVLPTKDPEYLQGYSMARLGDLVARRLPPSAKDGFHLYESLDLLFRMVNDGYPPRRAGEEPGEPTSEGEGLRFEPLRSDLFLPEAITLIGPRVGSDPDDPDGPKIDTRLRNATLHEVLRRLMITKGGRRKRGGFISYAQLGINQLGAVYEGLMSYTGFIATERLYEVAKHGDPKDGSWMIPESKVDDYDDDVFVLKEHPVTGHRSRVPYEPGQFVYRLAGRDRQTSASYYTPQSLTEVTVQLALKYRIEEAGAGLRARDLLDWTICEPALGSGAFLNEAINQVAAEYLRRRQKELGVNLEPEDYRLELQRVKAYIALHNCYGVDLNPTAVELAEVSIWLNVMHAGLQAPWFGLHLRRGNSLIGAGRRLYRPEQLTNRSWLTTAPEDRPFRDGDIEPGTVHHFLLPADGWGAVAAEREARELAPAETEKLKKWRTAIKRAPSAKATRRQPSQVARLQALAGRVEFLWKLVQRRLEISEREIRRDIPVWQPERPLPPADGAVPREKILADLTATGTPYWRLKTVMDVWCALWFWPLDAAGLLDGSADVYPADPVEVTHVREVPAYDAPVSYQKQDLFGAVEPVQLTMPAKPTRTRRVSFAEQLRRPVPLANLDDWLTFAEALLGRADLPTDSLVSQLTTLAELSEYEGRLEGLMGMESPLRLEERFPWLHTAIRIAEEQGFFHWELTFAQAFARGGFDLQVGNPPWVRPRWDEGGVLAEHDPWFRLAEKVPVEIWNARKKVLTEQSPEARSDFLGELAINSGMVAVLGHVASYPLLAGTQPNLYRAMMCQVWCHIAPNGIAGLLHPDTHFAGTKEGVLRAAAYSRLRVHAGFINAANWAFADATRSTEFGLHIYGEPGSIGFSHLSRLYAASVLPESLRHQGEGQVPGQRHRGAWDNRPHRSRVVEVDEKTLASWRRLRGEEHELPVEQTPLLQPITVEEERAISALAMVRRRLGADQPRISRGYDEANAKKDGVIRWRQMVPRNPNELIIQGPHLGVATPFAKQPRVPCRTRSDWDLLDLSSLPWNHLPRTNYVLSQSESANRNSQDLWGGRRYTEYYRLAWRRMIAFDIERSLFAALIPPGPAHVDAVHSLSMNSDLLTALQAGFWASLPLDYLLRIVGRADLRHADVAMLPAAEQNHPLASALLHRTLRLNCLTDLFSSLWSRLYERAWVNEQWVVAWPQIEPLGNVGPTWTRATPLRTEFARRAALVEIDALVAVWLGIGIEELLAILRARYPILTEREEEMWFDASGRKIAADPYTFGHGQTKQHYQQLMAYLDNPERNPVPEGYTAPFYKVDRENEYRQAHAEFSRRLAERPQRS